MKIFNYSALIILSFFIFSGCTLSNKNATRPETMPERDTVESGSIIAQAEWPDDVKAELVTIRMTVSAFDSETISRDFRFMGGSGEIYGIHGVPAGENRTVTLEGLSADNTKLYEGSLQDASIIPGQIIDSGMISMNPVQIISSEKSLEMETPANIRAQAGNGEVTLIWDSIPGAGSYSIYMNTSPGVSKKYFKEWETTTSNSYTWTGLTNGKTYYFVVTGESRESGEVNAAPGAPKTVPARKKARKKPPVKKKAPAPVVEPVAKPVPKPVPKPAAKPVPVRKKASVPVQKPTVREPAVTTGKLSPAELLRIADQTRAPGKTFTQEVKVTYKKGDKSTTNILVTRVKDAIKSLAIYKYPASQKGRVILMVENNMWIYFPGTKKPIRISPAQQLLGQVSNADVSRVVYSVDYDAVSVEDDNTGKEKLLKLNLKAKSKGAAYGSIEIWMKRDSKKLVKAKFYTLAGRILKTIYYKGYKNVQGRERPMIQEIHDAIKTSEMTIMEYSNMKVQDTSDNYFQKTFMHRAPQLK